VAATAGGGLAAAAAAGLVAPAAAGRSLAWRSRLAYCWSLSYRAGFSWRQWRLLSRPRFVAGGCWPGAKLVGGGCWPGAKSSQAAAALRQPDSSVPEPLDSYLRLPAALLPRRSLRERNQRERE